VTPTEFKQKWKASSLKEKSASQEHFIDLCRMLGQQTPAQADPKGEWFCFEKGAKMTGGGDGWADVWMRHHFAIEYKTKGKNLDQALNQLQRYTLALENPPLLIVSDMETIIIHTNFTSTIHEIHTIHVDEIDSAENLAKLRAIFTSPETLKPGVTQKDITEKAAGNFAEIAHDLRTNGNNPLEVAHFLNRILFCLFAEDVGLLPQKLLTRTLKDCIPEPHRFPKRMKTLFSAMKDGGDYGAETIDWFNGGLFDNSETIDLNASQIQTLYDSARLDWSQIQPSIFGTLFERGLDPSKRQQLGAHYTDPDSIMRIIEPVIISPLLEEWEEQKSKIPPLMAKYEKGGTGSLKAHKEAHNIYFSFLEKIRTYKVLDPACGSGNFLYLALHSLKDLEHRVILEAEQLNLPIIFPEVGATAVRGIELNPYAAELARVTIWIGDIQWMISHGFQPSRNPILKNLNQIDCRDALLTEDGSESEWPDADAIIGNPPFLGGKKQVSVLGEDYVRKLRGIYGSRVPGLSDFVTYWFEKSNQYLKNNNATRVGFVATNSVRDGFSRKVIQRIVENRTIYNAYSDEPWINDGAAVRVSIICFSATPQLTTTLNGTAINGSINSKLESVSTNISDLDFTKTTKIRSNSGLAFQGMTKSGPFEITGTLGRSFLESVNINGKSNADVLKPWVNGSALSRRRKDMWIIDFGTNMPESKACQYQDPFEYVKEHVKPKRSENRNPRLREKFWHYDGVRVGFRKAVSELDRYIATTITSKHRIFHWINKNVIPDATVVAIARSDDATLGILQSKFHLLWTLKTCSWLGKGNDSRYTPSSTFETFPFPEGFELDREPSQHPPELSQNIAIATKNLVSARERWINPPELTLKHADIIPEWPPLIFPKNRKSELELKSRTYTSLYNLMPSWLKFLHSELDDAVAKAYGISEDASDEEVLSLLFSLNQSKK